MRPLSALLLGYLLFSQSGAVYAAQGGGAGSAGDILKKGTMEWAITSGGGFSVAGGVQNISYWMLNGRWGIILTSDLCGGPFRGNLQYSVEIVPVMIVSQNSNVYAAGFSPLQLRYNFTATRQVMPFFEIGGFALPSTEKIPEKTSHFNFLTFGGFGFHKLVGSNKSLQFGMRYQHISNAGIVDYNPGINSLFLYAGFSLFKHK